MPKTFSSLPEKLLPYAYLGVDFNNETGQASADCIFCGGEGKLRINSETGLGDCKVPGCELSEGFNTYEFIRKWHALCFDTPTDYRELVEAKGIRDTTLIRWGIVKSPITGEWLIPGYSVNGSIVTLYRFRIGGRVLALGGLPHAFFRADSLSRSAGVVWVCEGPWDSMAAWEVLDSDSIVFGVPGASVFTETWAKSDLFEDREIVLAYDSDYPKRDRTGKEIPPAGLTGAKRAAGVLSSAGVLGENLNYLKWGEDGYDPALPSGYDLRDALNSLGEASSERLEAFETLRRRITLVPSAWLLRPKNPPAGKSGSKENPSSELKPLPCESYAELEAAWEKALKWTSGLDTALSVMLASSLTTQLVGEQLWVKIISPPGSGKTTLVEGLSVARRYTLSKDTIRGFYTGWSAGSEDFSIAALAQGKTLITKDGDTLLKSPNLSQILSEGRGLYDGAGRTHYRNNVSRDYEGHRMTWILCGTAALREIDDSELGSRFLDCVIMEGIDDDFEESVGLRAGEQELRNLLMQSNGVAEERYNPDLTRAMQLTGGYLIYLREHDTELVGSVKPNPSLIESCGHLASFVSRMRARPSKFQEEATREFSARLVKQLVRLSVALAAVLNRRTVDEEIFSRVNKVARDTSRGITFEISKLLYEAGRDGSTKSALSLLTDTPEARMLELLRFLKRIGVVSNFKKVGKNVNTGVRWRLTNKMTNLYQEVILGGEETDADS